MGRVSAAVVALAVAGLVLGPVAAGEGQAPVDRRARAERKCAMGRAWRAAGNPGSAAGYFRDAIRIDPTYSEPYAELGRVYLERGALDDAIEVFEAGRRYRPEHPRLGRLLARALAKDGQLERALETLRSLLRRHPGDVPAHLRRAELARRRGAWSEALASYRAVIDHAAGGNDVSDQQLAEARRYGRALELLVGESDPVRGQVDCAGRKGAAASPVRRALAGCAALREAGDSRSGRR